jgi:hypothetical protein
MKRNCRDLVDIEYYSKFVYNGAIVWILILYSNKETRQEGFLLSE